LRCVTVRTLGGRHIDEGDTLPWMCGYDGIPHPAQFSRRYPQEARFSLFAFARVEGLGLGDLDAAGFFSEVDLSTVGSW
jgi:hypothetical protein